MGSKKLKAVAVRGNQRIGLVDRSEMKETLKWITSTYQDSMKWAVDYGTSGSVQYNHDSGGMAVKNYLKGVLEDVSALSGDEFHQALVVERDTCSGCPVRCKIVVESDEPKIDKPYGGPEYESIGALGSLCEVNDPHAVANANQLCAAYGLDTISTGVTVAFAIECAEHGLLDGRLGDGLALSWGDAEAIVELVRRIARRDGIGDVLADGVKLAAQRIGGGAEAFAMHAGGQELPMHDARYEPALGLAYAVDPTPGRHNTANGGFIDVEALHDVFETEDVSLSGRYAYHQKGVEFALLNRYMQVVNCAGLCMFSLMMGQPPVRGWINTATGWALSLEELLRIGHRVQVLRHAFNLREGLPPGGASLPDRVKGYPPLEKGPLRGVSLDMEAMKQDYFRAMGYDEDGMPTRELLDSLGLTGVADDLQGLRG